jgi:hypothetical protein
MVETAAHLCDHVFPRLSVPKRLRYFMQRDGSVLNMVLRIFLRVIAQTLQTHSPGAAHVDRAALHIGAAAFIHRFGSSLNGHVHFYVCAVDGVFEEVVGSVISHPVSGIDADAVVHVQATLRRRILRAFVGRGLLRYCARPSLACPPHADHRCGMPLVTRRWVRARKLTQAGIWQHNRHRTTRWTSASIGDSVKRRFAKLWGAAACAVEPNPSWQSQGLATERL